MKKATSIDAYLATQPEAVRARLEQLRATIHRAVPGAEEAISYGMPAFKLHGRTLLFFAGWKAHYALYPGTGRLVEALGDALAPYQVSKGTIRFPVALPVPVRLVTRIARLRAAESAERAARAPRRGAGRATGGRRAASAAPAARTPRRAPSGRGNR